jgi:ribonuclease BN (tRNA processing enzyme)
MQPPYFPVDLHEVGSHLHCVEIEHPNSTMLVIHPHGGRKVLTVEAFERLINNGGQIPFAQSTKFDLSECLVITMQRSNHPERTIVYRFEERSSGLVFVFVTDHENQDGVPTRLVTHLQGADLLVMDTQYTRQKYETVTAGWGHATPDYTARVAMMVGAKALGLTHHDPGSTDTMVEDIVATAQGLLTATGSTIPVFGCRDYMVVEVDNVAAALT